MSKRLLSIVVPAYNEEANIAPFYQSLLQHLPDKYSYELLFVNDGSKDNTADQVRLLAEDDQRVKLLSFSRNFGKEIATTAGIHTAKGDAILLLDADGQHPVELIPEFITRWEGGDQVVIGVRESYKNEGFVKKQGSRLFYSLFNRLTKVRLVPGSTDFRLIDKAVQRSFARLEEMNRITRGLIDWLGYRRSYIHFHAKDRLHGEVAYSTKKLISLAINTFVSLSFMPLFLFGYIGAIITVISLFTGLFVIIEQFILNDPLGLRVTGSASLGILVIFLVGIVLISQSLMSLYISRIYEESKRRPLYIIDDSQSILG